MNTNTVLAHMLSMVLSDEPERQQFKPPWWLECINAYTDKEIIIDMDCHTMVINSVKCGTGPSIEAACIDALENLKN